MAKSPRATVATAAAFSVTDICSKLASTALSTANTREEAANMLRGAVVSQLEAFKAALAGVPPVSEEAYKDLWAEPMKAALMSLMKRDGSPLYSSPASVMSIAAQCKVTVLGITHKVASAATTLTTFCADARPALGAAGVLNYTAREPGGATVVKDEVRHHLAGLCKAAGLTLTKAQMDAFAARIKGNKGAFVQALNKM